MTRRRDDRGTVAMFTTIFALFVFVLAGLLVDGGLEIHARERAADIAEQAARAAADDVDLDYLRRTGKARIASQATACARARRLVAAYREVTKPADCRVVGNEARVVVEIQVRFQLLGAFGFKPFPVSSTASAHPQEGI